MNGFPKPKGRRAMQNIHVGRYSKESIDGAPGVGNFWQGWVEPDDKSWIVFIDIDGHPVVFLNRDPKTGAVLD
jgi:hypothetical protein